MERFWSKVDDSGDCWMWTAATRRTGYGAIKIDGKVFDAHRVSYELTYGLIPNGMRVLHKCDHRLCVRPEHLFLGTQRDNVLDAINKGRHHFIDPPILTVETVREARRLHEQGKSYSSLGRRYGVDRMTIRSAVQRRSWKTVA